MKKKPNMFASRVIQVLKKKLNSAIKSSLKYFFREQFHTRIVWYFQCFDQPETILKHEKLREGWIELFVFSGKKKSSWGFPTGETSYIETVGFLTSVTITEYYLIWLLPHTCQEKNRQDCECFAQLRWLVVYMNISEKPWKGRHVYEGKYSYYQERRVLHNFQWNFNLC